MTKLKTLKDISVCTCFKNEIETSVCVHCRLKQEAIKWIKEDMYHYEKDGFVSVVDMKQIARWMKRLDITEGDLE